MSVGWVLRLAVIDDVSASTQELLLESFGIYERFKVRHFVALQTIKWIELGGSSSKEILLPFF
jgi:hypothetical protein